MGEFIGKITYLVIVVVALVVFVIFGSKLIPFAKQVVDKFTGKEEMVIEKARPYLDEMLANFEICDEINDYNCFCEVFPNFPASLPKEIKLKFSPLKKDHIVKFGTNLTAYYLTENNIKDWRKLEEEYKLLNVDNGKKTEWISPENKKELKFDEYKGYPLVKTIEGDFILLSSFLFKERVASYFVGIYKTKTITRPHALIEKEIDPEKISKEIEEKIKEMPKCVDGRAEAITFFEALVENLKNKVNTENLEINIGEDFYIEADNNEIGLYKDGKIVKSMSIVEGKSLKDWQVLEVKYSGEKLTCDGESFRLVKGDKINLKNGCIEFKKL